MSYNSTDRAVHRRCAAYAALEAVLQQPELLESLWMLQENYHSEEMSGIMSYVSAIAQKFGLPAAVRKQLYQNYFAYLRASPKQLPGDPWPMMLAYRSHGETTNFIAAKAAAVTAPVPPPIEEPPPKEPLSAELCIFGNLLANACAMVKQRHTPQWEELGESFFVLLKSEAPKSVHDEFHAWWQASGENDWRMDLPVKQLGHIVHLYYLALCEAVGPVAADQLLTKAAAKTAELPEAGIFSPHSLF